MVVNQEAQPDTRGLAQQAMLEKVTVYRDVLGGTARMREKAAAYLPQFPLEDVGRYNRRVQQTVLHNATRLTVDALVGMAFREDPELAADLPDEIKADAENIDLGGRHLAVFARQLFEDAWDGVAAILVDMQVADPDRIRTLEDERRELRPYWVSICASDILRARSMTVNGVEVASRFAYIETATVDDGEFGEKQETRVREYRRTITGTGTTTTCTVYVRSASPAPGVAAPWGVKEGYPVKLSLGEIPVVPVYTGRRTGYFAAEPSLLDLAYENIDHFQQRSEHRVSFQYARVPLMVFPGMTPDRVEIAPDKGICTDDPNSKPYWMEFTGGSIQQSREELRDGERRMAAHGASMLLRSEGTPVTATERRIEEGQSTSRLGAAVRALQDALEGALAFHARWRNTPLPQATGGRWVTMSRDFEAYEMDAQQVGALDNAVLNDHLTLETFLTALKGGVKPLAMLDVEREAETLRNQVPTPLLDAA